MDILFLAFVIRSNVVPDILYQSVHIAGGSARKQSYEPLLLENEREAVSELLHHLESESKFRLPTPTSSASLIYVRCRPNDHQLLYRISPRFLDHPVLQRQCRPPTIRRFGLRRDHGKGSKRGRQGYVGPGLVPLGKSRYRSPASSECGVG